MMKTIGPLMVHSGKHEDCSGRAREGAPSGGCLRDLVSLCQNLNLESAL
jgi:hypothetical protein